MEQRQVQEENDNGKINNKIMYTNWMDLLSQRSSQRPNGLEVNRGYLAWQITKPQ